MNGLSAYTIALLVLAPLLVWRVYSRVKSMMKRQRSSMQRHYTGALVFTAIVLVTTSQLLHDLGSLGWLVVGTLGGIGYAVWGLKLTRFEDVKEGYFFTPNERLGLIIAMLFVAAVMYVAFEIYANQGMGSATPKVTDYIFFMPCLGLMAGYFGTYSVGLLRWRWKLRKAIEAA